MKRKLELLIRQFVQGYPGETPVQTRWREPLVAFADAGDPGFSALKEAVRPTHAMPRDLLPEAETVIVYFIPFDEAVAAGNAEGRLCSRAWAAAYVETNRLIADLNAAVQGALEKWGYRACGTPATHNFDPKILKSDWSHRHVGRLAGLGTFGLNNMLITDKGCCGRLGSLITDLKLTPSPKIDGEFCLYKRSGSCGLCAARCVGGALKTDGFDRHACYQMCLENDAYHHDGAGGLADVCGKCLVGLPCSTANPAKGLRRGK